MFQLVVAAWSYWVVCALIVYGLSMLASEGEWLDDIPDLIDDEILVASVAIGGGAKIAESIEGRDDGDALILELLDAVGLLVDNPEDAAEADRGLVVVDGATGVADDRLEGLEPAQALLGHLIELAVHRLQLLVLALGFEVVGAFDSEGCANGGQLIADVSVMALELTNGRGIVT